MEFDDPELTPTIIPLDARLSIRGTVEEFRTLFDRLNAVVPVKEKIPGTSLVSVVASSDGVRFSATDGAQTLVLDSTTLRVGREGKALLPAAKFKAIFGLAPDAAASLTVVDNTATVTSGRAVWNVVIPAGGKTLLLPDVSDIELHEVTRRALYRALNSVKRALPTSGSRKSLEQADIAAGSVTASDGYRLIRQKIEGFPEGLSLSIPKATVEEFMRSLQAGGDETVRLGASNDLIVLQDGGTTLISGQLALTFPDLEPQLVAPALENKNSIIVDTAVLRDLIKRVRISADPEYASIVLKFAKAKDGSWELNVLTRDRTGNSASESMDALWEGEVDPFDLTINHKFLSDLLDAYPGSLATLRVGAGSKTRAAPLLLKDDARGFTAVVQQSAAR